MRKHHKQSGYEPEVLQHLHEVQVQILKDFIRVCDKYNFRYFAVYGTALGAVRHQGFIPWDDDIDVGMLREDYDKFLQVFDKELSDQYALLTSEIDERYACTVTHIQKKGTKFVSEDSQDLKCAQCIFIDIFPYDYVADNKLAQKKQELMTLFFGKLLFLAGTAYPFIPLKGLLRELAGFVCVIIHSCLKILRISPKTLYRKYLLHATAYNKSGASAYVTSFENPGALQNKIAVADMYPFQTTKFENIEISIPANSHEILSHIYGDYMQLPPEEQRINHRPIEIDFGEE